MCLVFLDTRGNINDWDVFGGGCLWSCLIVKVNLMLACSPLKVRTKENYSILRWNTQFEFTHISVNSNIQISVFYRVIFKEVDSYWKFITTYLLLLFVKLCIVERTLREFCGTNVLITDLAKKMAIYMEILFSYPQLECCNCGIISSSLV